MKFLLDTNVLSDARLGRSHQVAHWVSSQQVGDLAISAISLLEIERGVQQKERRDPVGAKPLRLWLEEQVLPAFSGRILPVDEQVAKLAASFHIPDPQPEFDALIAATAVSRDLVLVTRNVNDFQQLKIDVLNPWEI